MWRGPFQVRAPILNPHTLRPVVFLSPGSVFLYPFNRLAGGADDRSRCLSIVKLGQFDVLKLDILVINLMHDNEHYGNLVTYMRMKNIVPPSSEQQTAPPPPKK